jgi:hypothetical protein
MKTTEIFKRSDAKKINETIQKTFGQRISFENYNLDQLEDSRNRLRTQIYQFKQASGFNETLENVDYSRAQWMLDAINAEIEERGEVAMESPEGNLPETQTGEEMSNQVRESATDKASAVVTAKSMVDRVGRWIEDLAQMENDQLLELGDVIRDEMGQEQAKAFVSQVAPAIQTALATLKTTREALSSGVRVLSGDEQPTDMLGAEPTDDMGGDMGGDMGDDMGAAPAAPDEMNLGDEMPPEDDFAAAEPASGPDEAGRAKRESINRSNQLLKVLAG